MLALRVGLRRGRLHAPPRPPTHSREPRLLCGIGFRAVLRPLPSLLLARQIGGERRELLVTGLPQRPQLIEHQRAEAGFRVAEQLTERVQLLLDAYGRAFLLLEAIAQQMKLVLEVGIGLLEASTILEELHEPLFVGTRGAPVQTSFEKAQLIDQNPAFASSVKPRDIPGTPGQSRPLKVMAPLGTVFQPFI